MITQFTPAFMKNLPLIEPSDNYVYIHGHKKEKDYSEYINMVYKDLIIDGKDNHTFEQTVIPFYSPTIQQGILPVNDFIKLEIISKGYFRKNFYGNL